VDPPALFIVDVVVKPIVSDIPRGWSMVAGRERIDILQTITQGVAVSIIALPTFQPRRATTGFADEADIG
jgi:hypothetical protein